MRKLLPIVACLLLVTSSTTAYRAVRCSFIDDAKVCIENQQLAAVVSYKSISELELNVTDFVNINPGAFATLSLASLKLLHPNPKHCARQVVALEPSSFRGLRVSRHLMLECMSLRVSPRTFQNFGEVNKLSLHAVNIIGNLTEFFANFRSLRVLELSNFGIQMISSSMLSGISSNLNKLVVHTRLNFIQRNSFERFPRLRELTLSDCQLMNIPDMFDGLGQLHTLNLEMNQFATLYHTAFRRLKQLKVLYLGYNNISEIQADAFYGLNLDTLDLTRNQISNLSAAEFSNLRSLTRLELGKNQIQMIRPDIFPTSSKLRLLNLEMNKISVLYDNAFSNVTQLRVLYLGYNKISEIQSKAFHGLDLDTLDLTGNQITDLSAGVLDNLYNLKRLELGYNKIQDLDKRTFQGCRRLRLLNLEYNRIHEIQSDTFSGFTFDILDLNHNHLSKYTLIDTNVTDVLDLRDNPLATTDELKVLTTQNLLLS